MGLSREQSALLQKYSVSTVRNRPRSIREYLRPNVISNVYAKVVATLQAI